MFNSFLFNQNAYNSPLIISSLNSYIEDLNFIISVLVQEEDLQDYLDDVDINIISIVTIKTDFIDRFFRINLSRKNRVDILLRKRVLQEKLTRPEIKLNLVRKSSEKINLRRPRIRINLERIGDK